MNKDTFEGGMRKAVGTVESFAGRAGNEPKTEAQGIADKASGSAQSAVGQVKDAVAVGASKVADAVGSGDYAALQADISKLTQTVSQLVQNQASSAQDKFVSMEAELEEKVKRNPMSAVAIALAAGFFLGKIT